MKYIQPLLFIPFLIAKGLFWFLFVIGSLLFVIVGYPIKALIEELITLYSAFKLYGWSEVYKL